jgi:hypothetical protein
MMTGADQERNAEMTQQADPQPDQVGSDVTRGASPKIQPVLGGLVLAAIIAAIALAAFWTT